VARAVPYLLARMRHDCGGGRAGRAARTELLTGICSDGTMARVAGQCARSRCWAELVRSGA
jgi:hypothetical protein